MEKSITELLEKILTSVYGEDVRKSIHDSIQRCYEDATKEGNANMEVSQARGIYTSLSERLAADLSNTIERIDEGDSRLRTIIDSVVSGSPFVASSTSEMIDTSRVYVNTTDGHWYWYDGSNWQDGGVYQAAENSKTVNNLDTMVDGIIFGDLDIISKATVLNRNATSYDPPTLAPVWSNNNSFTNYTIPITSQGKLRIGRATHFQYAEKCFLLKDDGAMPGTNYFFMMKTEHATGTKFCYDIVEFFENYVEIDMEEAYSRGIRFLSFTYFTQDNHNVDVQTCKIYNALYSNWLIDNQTHEYVPEIIVSSYATAILGREWNLYFSNVIPYLPENMYIEVSQNGLTSNDINQFADRIRYIPTNIESGTITIKIRDKVTETTIVQKTINMLVLNAQVSTDKYIVCIGDSLTDSDFWVAEVEHNLSNNKIHSVGTIRNKVNNIAISENEIISYNEGRSGWSSTDYAGSSSSSHPIKESYNGKTNAFYNNGVFDFSNYMNNLNLYTGNDVTVQNSFIPNAVVIGLGTNGTNYLEYSLEGLERIITSIENYNSSIPIILSIITMPATQDGVGYNNHLQNADHMKNQIFNHNKAIIEEYENNPAHPNVHLAEVNYNLDCLHDYPTTQTRVSARNPLEVTMQINNVHPSVYGYLKFADTYFANLVRYMI